MFLNWHFTHFYSFLQKVLNNELIIVGIASIQIDYLGIYTH